MRVLGGTTLEGFVMKHLEFLGFPIELYVENLKEKEVTDSEQEVEDLQRGGR